MLGVRTGMAAVSFCLMLAPLTLQAEPTLEERVQKVSAYYADHYARMYGVPLELVEAIIEVESAWRPEALSLKGAAGVMQLMPDTAQRFQVRNRYNIEQNIRAGVQYLARLNQLFKGDLRLVSAAYLAGEGRVLHRGLAYSSPEVFTYVSQVARIYHQKRQIHRQRKIKGEK